MAMVPTNVQLIDLTGFTGADGFSMPVTVNTTSGYVAASIQSLPIICPLRVGLPLHAAQAGLGPGDACRQKTHDTYAHQSFPDVHNDLINGENLRPAKPQRPATQAENHTWAGPVWATAGFRRFRRDHQAPKS